MEEEPVEIEARNEVRLVGRVASEALEVDLPSGDRLVTFRLVVDRAPSKRPVPEGSRPPTVDTLDCVAWAAGTQRTVRSFGAGDWVEVQGALRRRFWRSPAGAASRYEVELESAKRLARAA